MRRIGGGGGGEASSSLKTQRIDLEDAQALFSLSGSSGNATARVLPAEPPGIFSLAYFQDSFLPHLRKSISAHFSTSLLMGSKSSPLAPSNPVPLADLRAAGTLNASNSNEQETLFKITNTNEVKEIPDPFPPGHQRPKIQDWDDYPNHKPVLKNGKPVDVQYRLFEIADVGDRIFFSFEVNDLDGIGVRCFLVNKGNGLLEVIDNSETLLSKCPFQPYDTNEKTIVESDGAFYYLRRGGTLKELFSTGIETTYIQKLELGKPPEIYIEAENCTQTDGKKTKERIENFTRVLIFRMI